jgi:hypothetical protein
VLEGTIRVQLSVESAVNVVALPAKVLTCAVDRRQQDGVGDAVKQQRAAVITGETEEACRGPASSNKI